MLVYKFSQYKSVQYNGNKAVFWRDFNAFYTKGFTGGKISEVNSRGNEVNGLYSQGEIKISKKAVDMDAGIDEIAADYIGNEKFALDTAMHDLTLAEKIRGMARDILDALGIKKYSEAERIARVWEKACEEAKRSVKKADSKVGNDVKREGEVKYSIVTLSNGMKYVQADEQVTSGNDPNKWEQQIIDYVNKKVRQGTDVVIPLDNGDKIKITGRTAWKLGYRNGSQYGNPIGKKFYMVKGNASGVIDEIIKISHYAGWEQDRGGHKFASKGFEYRKAHFMDLDKTYYELKISVGISPTGKEAYNIGEIKKIQPPIGSKSGTGSKTPMTASTNSVAQQTGKVNTSQQNNSEKSSSGDLNEVIRENEKLKKENEKLKELKDHYKGQMLRSPNQYAPSSVNIKKVVNRVAKGYTGNRNLADDIKQAQELLSKCIASSGKGNTERANELYNQYKERIDFIAGDIANNTRQKNDSLYREYRRIKDRLKGVTVKIDKSWENDLNGVNGYNEFRKRNFGTVKMSRENGTPIDVLYNELGGQFGELFPEEIVNSADQLIYLTDLLKSMSDFYENPYNSDMDGAIEGISETIDLELLALSGERTQADKYFDEAQKQIKAEQRKKRADNARKKEEMSARQKLLTLSRRMKRIAKNGKTTQANQALINELIGHVDTVAVSMTDRTVRNLESLSAWYQEAAKRINFVPNPRIEEDLARLDAYSLTTFI